MPTGFEDTTTDTGQMSHKQSISILKPTTRRSSLGSTSSTADKCEMTKSILKIRKHSIDSYTLDYTLLNQCETIVTKPILKKPSSSSCANNDEESDGIKPILKKSFWDDWSSDDKVKPILKRNQVIPNEGNNGKESTLVNIIQNV